MLRPILAAALSAMFGMPYASGQHPNFSLHLPSSSYAIGSTESPRILEAGCSIKPGPAPKTQRGKLVIGCVALFGSDMSPKLYGRLVQNPRRSASSNLITCGARESEWCLHLKYIGPNGKQRFGEKVAKVEGNDTVQFSFELDLTNLQTWTMKAKVNKAEVSSIRVDLGHHMRGFETLNWCFGRCDAEISTIKHSISVSLESVDKNYAKTCRSLHRKSLQPMKCDPAFDGKMWIVQSADVPAE